MLKRLAAIAFIFVCSSIGWAVLARTINSRTYSSDNLLRGRMAEIRGSDQKQLSPSLSITEAGGDGRQFFLEHLQKGLIWFSTYKVAFAGDYTFRINGAAAVQAQFRLSLPAALAVYDDLAVVLDGMPFATHGGNALTFELGVTSGESVRLRVTYRSRGLDRWDYRFGDESGQAKNFICRVRTNFR